MKNLHYSLYKGIDSSGDTFILDLSCLATIEITADHHKEKFCTATLSTDHTIYLSLSDGESLIDAWNRYKHAIGSGGAA